MIYFNPRSPHGERPPFRRLVRPLRGDFNPRSPHGERPPASGRGRRCSGISTHAPRTGSDVVVKVPICRAAISTHAPRTGSDHAFGTAIQLGDISTHAPRTGSDSAASVSTFASNVFQPTLPARGATRFAARCCSSARHFNPRSPHGERLFCACTTKVKISFQPTLPARGATAFPARCCSSLSISTHAPRTGSDCALLYGCAKAQIFQPTLPARGATFGFTCITPIPPYFNPRSPHGERRI